MTALTVTSFSKHGAAIYGRRMVESYQGHCQDVPLVVYADSPMVFTGVEVRLTSNLLEWLACRRRWASDLSVQGRSTPERPFRKAYRYIFDANRFAVKVFVWRDAAERLGEGVLTWLDGDTQFTVTPPDGWAESLLGDADVAYLGRGPMHPETGYVGFRIPQAWPLLDWCCEAYSSEQFRSLDGYTDCHVIRAGLQAVLVKARDLTTHRYRGKAHIWPLSPLAPFVTHFKGGQKVKLAVRA